MTSKEEWAGKLLRDLANSKPENAIQVAARHLKAAYLSGVYDEREGVAQDG